MQSNHIPEGYQSLLNLRETELGIKRIKDFFQVQLAQALDITRVSAPLFVHQSSGLNDMLSGAEVPVFFKAPHVESSYLEIVHSLAKWKRTALYRYGFTPGEGLYTDMNAIRREEELDAIHSLYVDQWDWEKIITADMRNFKYLKETVETIYHVLLQTQDFIFEKYPALKGPLLPPKITFISTQELEDMYPKLSFEAREKKASKEFGAIFIHQIGDTLKGGKPHGMRSPDYDDWKLNGDIIVWNPVTQDAFELSSMGIRVDSDSLRYQLEQSGDLDRMKFDYHQNVIDNVLPLTIGGGIGQSRICMLLLRKAHIGEVQASVWDKATLKEAKSKDIILL